MREEALYVLRLWRDGDRLEDWRASVEDVRTRHCEVFGELDALVEFLVERTANGSGPDREQRCEDVERKSIEER